MLTGHYKLIFKNVSINVWSLFYMKLTLCNPQDSWWVDSREKEECSCSKFIHIKQKKTFVPLFIGMFHLNVTSKPFTYVFQAIIAYMLVWFLSGFPIESVFNSKHLILPLRCVSCMVTSTQKNYLVPTHCESFVKSKTSFQK